MLARKAWRACSQSFPRSLLSSRHISSSNHHEQGHHRPDPQESTYYTHEGFATPFWRNVVLVSLLSAGLYKYAPEPSGDVYLTRWIAMYALPREHWLDLNAKHTVLSQSVSDEGLLFRDAKRPQVQRYRYPQALEQCSSFLAPVGMNVDMRHVVVKGDKD